jgi:adenine phosphoribosyltransferase
VTARSTDDLRAKIREVPDFPKPGILFYDITTLLREADAFREVIDRMADAVKGERIDLVVGMESRGFIFAAPLADRLGAGFVPVRKLGKLPAETREVE